VIKLKPQPHLMTANEMIAEPLLASLEDAGAIGVRGADGKARTVRVGDGLQLGDSFQTGEKASARVAFEQGVQLLLPPGTLVRLGEEDVVGPGGGMNVPRVEVEKGELRVMVETSTKPAAEAETEAAKRPLKFLVRTKAAVLGVRGTDFVVSVADDHTNVRMVSGTVELATEPRAIGMGQTVKIGQFEGAEAVAGRPLPQPEHVDIGTFLREFHDRNPRLEELWNAAVRDAKTQALRPRFLKLRTLKVDQVNLQNGFAPSAVREEAEKNDEIARKWKLREQGLQDEGTPGTKTKRRRKHRSKAVREE
jgi:hypothetical protein